MILGPRSQEASCLTLNNLLNIPGTPSRIPEYESKEGLVSSGWLCHLSLSRPLPSVDTPILRPTRHRCTFAVQGANWCTVDQRGVGPDAFSLISEALGGHLSLWCQIALMPKALSKELPPTRSSPRDTTPKSIIIGTKGEVMDN